MPETGSRSSLADQLTSLGSDTDAARTFVAVAALGTATTRPNRESTPAGGLVIVLRALSTW